MFDMIGPAIIGTAILYLIWRLSKSSVMIVVHLLELIVGGGNGANVMSTLEKNIRYKARFFRGREFTVVKVEIHHSEDLTLYLLEAIDDPEPIQLTFQVSHPDHDSIMNLTKSSIIKFILHKNSYHGGEKTLESAYLSLNQD